LHEYARRKSIEVANNPTDFILPWVDCAQCKQRYRHQLAIDLLDECHCFVQGQFPGSAMLASIFTGAQKSKKKQAEIVETSLSLINQLSITLDRSIHPMYVRAIEAEALDMIGQYKLLHGDLTEVEAINV
jgi:hypothetical protein